MGKKYLASGNITRLKKRHFKFDWNSPLGEYIRTNPIRGVIMLFSQWWNYVPDLDYVD